MAAITPTPLFMKDAIVKFGATNTYEAAVRDIKFTPSASIVTTEAITPSGVYSNVTKATWTLEMTYLQDWKNATSLSRYLFDNEGSSVTLVFTPVSGDTTTITATVVITPGAIGGAVGAYAEGTVTLASSKPVIA